MDDEESSDKQYEATQKKLDDARKKGEFPRSMELMTATSYGGTLIVAVALGPSLFLALGGVLQKLLEDASGFAEHFFIVPGSPTMARLMIATMKPVSVWFLAPFACVIAMVFAQRAMVFATEKIKPNLRNISPVSNAKNKFGSNGLFEFGKSAVKLFVYSIILFSFLFDRLPRIVMSMALDPGQVAALMLRLSLEFMALVFLVTVVTGLVDYFWQRSQHLRKNMMSRKELTDEAKDSEGDPHVKQQRRERAIAIATNRMLADVPTADVVVVNPLHYAVALKWSRLPGSAPVCVAKGVDEIAARIRETAIEAGVPLHRDPPTARTLFASVELGSEISPEYYRVVAAALRFADEMRARSRDGGSGHAR